MTTASRPRATLARVGGGGALVAADAFVAFEDPEVQDAVEDARAKVDLLRGVTEARLKKLSRAQLTGIVSDLLAMAARFEFEREERFERMKRETAPPPPPPRRNRSPGGAAGARARASQTPISTTTTTTTTTTRRPAETTRRDREWLRVNQRAPPTRVETESAVVVIQAHARGYLSRARARENRSRRAREGVDGSAGAPAAKSRTTPLTGPELVAREMARAKMEHLVNEFKERKRRDAAFLEKSARDIA